MQGSGHQLFAHAGGSRDENASEMRGNAANLREEFKHQWTAANHPVELEIFKEVVLQLQGLLPVFRILLHLPDFLAEFLRRKRLGKIVGGSILNCLDR